MMRHAPAALGLATIATTNPVVFPSRGSSSSRGALTDALPRSKSARIRNLQLAGSLPVVCEAAGAAKPAFCKDPGKLLGGALGQGESLVRSVETWSAWIAGWKGGVLGGGGSSGGSGNGSGGDGPGGEPWGEGDDGADPGAVEDEAVSGLVEEEDEEEDDKSEEEEEAEDEEERFLGLSDLDGKREYVCEEVKVVNVEGMQPEEDFAPYKILNLTPGSALTKSDILTAQAHLLSTGWYKSVTVRCASRSSNAIKLQVLTEDATYATFSSFQCLSNSVPPRRCLLPKSIRSEITTSLQGQTQPTRKTLSDVQEKVEGWYHDQGYVHAKVKGFRRSPETGTVLECHVDEGVVSEVNVSCVDEGGEVVACHTNRDVVLETLPEAVRQGMQWNAGAGETARRRVEQLGLFDKVNVELRAAASTDDSDSDSDCEASSSSGVALHLRLKESPRQSADVRTEWSFLCNDAGRPNLRTLQPGGSLCVHHRNISGLNRTVSGCVSTSNLLRPEDDLRFKLEYVHPLVKGFPCVHPRLEGLKNLHNHTLRLLAFNKRKLSATYYDADHFQEAPAVWVDRAGIKASVVEKLSEQSKLAYGVVVEEVATRDDVGTICRQRGSNSSTGIDHMAFLQMKITRSNLKAGETGLVGARDIFQVDQGVGLGTRAPMFNRHQLAMTRYMPLFRSDTPKDEVPTVLVLHGRYGGCLGDVVNYRSFSNGGPYNLRGNNVGELAGFSRFIEVAGEVRFPVPQQMEGYCFVDSLTSLQTFGAIRNNPSKLADRIGKGLMYGAGIKMGNVRLEYVIECNDQTGSLKVYTGERY